MFDIFCVPTLVFSTKRAIKAPQLLV